MWEVIGKLISENLINILTIIIVPSVSAVFAYFVSRAKTNQELNNMRIAAEKLEAERKKVEAEKATLDLENMEKANEFWQKHSAKLQEQIVNLTKRVVDLEACTQENRSLKDQNEIQKKQIETHQRREKEFRAYVLDLKLAFDYIAEVLSRTNPDEVAKAKAMIQKHEKFLEEVAKYGTET